ncbi:hypothetical protein JCM8208_000428 [Rhodotorula glutinis]
MAPSARPLVDRQRSTSRERGLLVRPTLSSSNSLSSLGPTSPISSPVGSPPALHSILKHHPAEDEDARGRGGAPRGGAAAAGGGTVEGSLSSLALGGGSANTSTTAVDGSERTSATGDSGARTPASGNGGARGTQFKRRVGFDTWGAGEELADKAKATGGGTGVAYSFTLAAKSADYCRTRWSRTFLVATDLNEYSVNATDWLLQSFVEDSDEVVVLRVIEPGSSAHNVWRASMEEARDEAEKMLHNLMEKNGERKHISIIVEFAIGPIEETIHRMIEIYKPDSLIVGTRGRPDSLFKSAFMGSISRWAVARSPVPVVVVRPDAKVREALERRLQDHKRGRSYVSLLTEEERRRFLPPTTNALSTTTTRTATSSTAGSAGGSSGSGLGPLTGSPLERIVTAPEAHKARREDSASSADKGSSGGGSSGGGGIMAALGLGKKKEKSKGLEFKKFGTFS